jgi:hypothetical protein
MTPNYKELADRIVIHETMEIMKCVNAYLSECQADDPLGFAVAISLAADNAIMQSPLEPTSVIMMISDSNELSTALDFSEKSLADLTTQFQPGGSTYAVMIWHRVSEAEQKRLSGRRSVYWSDSLGFKIGLGETAGELKLKFASCEGLAA